MDFPVKEVVIRGDLGAKDLGSLIEWALERPCTVWVHPTVSVEPPQFIRRRVRRVRRNPTKGGR